MPEFDAAVTSWESVAACLTWAREPDVVYVDDPPRGRWFAGGRLNVAENCVHRHVAERGDVVAFHWEGEPEDRRSVSYAELDADVRRFASALRSLGVRPGDRVVLHVGLVPECVVAMLACARLGAVHVLMPAVLPPEAVEERVAGVGARVVITQDGAWRHGMVIPLKARTDEAVAAVSTVEHTIVIRRTGMDVAWYEGDRWFHELVQIAAPDHGEPAAFSAEHPLCVGHVANRRGRPTGLVHGSANMLASMVAIHAGAFAAETEVFWFPSEIGWLPVQAHCIYGPLACGGTTVLFEGMLDTPSHERTWQIVERYGVGVLAATASISRTLRSWSDAAPSQHDLGSLRMLVSVAEAIDPGLRRWLEHDMAAHGIEVVDAWGQTELTGLVALNEPSRSHSTMSVGLDVVDDDGRSLPPGETGELVLRAPWPGTFIGIEGLEPAAARCFTRHPGSFATGDRARRREDGTFEFIGRIDPVISVSGQLVSLTEVQEALLEHPHVVRAVAGQRADPRTGLAVVALVEPQASAVDREQLARELRSYVHDTLGGLSRPRTIVFADSLDPSLPAAALRTALRALCTAHPKATALDATPAEIATLASQGE